MTTSKGYSVAGFSKYFSAGLNCYKGWSGRVRVVVGNPYHDEYVRWNEQGKAINHKLGDVRVER